MTSMKRHLAYYAANKAKYQAYYLANRERIKERSRANREKTKTDRAAYERRRHYGLTEDQYEALVLAHDNRCAICGQPETATRNGIVKALAIDHDHDTGEIRGLLCQQHNVAIGMLNDSSEMALAAAAYLQRFNK